MQPYAGAGGLEYWNALCQQAADNAAQDIAAACGGQTGIAAGVGIDYAVCRGH